MHVAPPERLLRARDRLLASPRFQQWALRFPLTRWIARRRAAALFDICAGFVYSQVLLACVRLHLFELLKDEPRSLKYLEWRLGLTRASLLTLLHAAHALDLLQWREYEQVCGLGRHGAALLGNPGLLPMIEHHVLFYADLRDPVALLKQVDGAQQLAAFWPYAAACNPGTVPADQVTQYTALMSASQPFISAEILGAYHLQTHRCLLDLGGGDGTFSEAAAHAAPNLRIRCFDLPAVASMARARFARSGLTARAEAVGGDFLADPLPTGCDIVSLIRVLHDHDDERALRILRAVRQVLPEDGTLLIAEPVAATQGGSHVADAYFGFYLLAMGSGKPRTLQALTALLFAAGFTHPTVRSTYLPMHVRVLVARPRQITMSG